MEAAGKDITDEEMREAMKESGIGTPATRGSIIERLIAVGYIEREGRALQATEKGVKVIELLGEHVITSAELTQYVERHRCLPGTPALREMTELEQRGFTRSQNERRLRSLCRQARLPPLEISH